MKTLILALTSALPFAAAHASSNHESVPANEAVAIQETVKIIADALKAQHAAEGGTMKRDAHAKHHGCVRATFEVLPKVPEGYKYGLFAQAKSYPAWIRFSNGSGRSQDDSDGDGRGIAIKVMKVPGAKLLEDERDAQTQDFLLINHPAFFVKDAADYVEFQKAAVSGNMMKFFFPGLNPLNWRTKEMKIANAIRSKKVTQMLETRYWSMSAYDLGSNSVKYSVMPCEAASGHYKATSSPNFLRENMASFLDEKEGCFLFAVQRMNWFESVEDATEEWDESRIPFTPVAKITIPKQDFSSQKQMQFCEDLSFTPWHSLPDHQPIGGINRLRKVVYQEISKLRHEKNQARREEPTGDEKF